MQTDPISQQLLDPDAGKRAVRSSVLVVDDDQRVLEYLKVVLEMGGFRVGTACGATAALQFHTGTSVDILVTDIDMPGRDGLELATDLLARQPNLPVLFITGGAHVRKPNIVQPEQVILQKPIPARVLISTVTRMLNGS